MKRNTRNAVKAKQEIIEKSAPVFNVYGYAGTKMQMLVDATGYQMGGIYRHFETKMDLAREVFRYNFEILIKSNLDLAPELSPKEKLLQIMANYEAMIRNPKVIGGCPILNTSTEVDDTDEALSILTKSFIQEVIGEIERILRQGQAQNLLQPHFDPKQEALYLFASFEGAIVLAKSLRKLSPVRVVFGKIREYLEDKVFLT
ncbi:MAG: TetR/AcrR family transcriptional regulator [Saprospiraceae bacterium]|nr:TetR/AcrR family transcriptional regulator [Saprospiraceae bacterium]